MKKFALSTLVCAAMAAGTFSVHASGLGDALRGQLGGAAESGSSSSSGLSSSGLSSMLGGGSSAGAGGSALSALGLGGLTGSGTASNAAGVITYCMKNNYLNADKAAQVKEQLLGKLGLGQKEEPKDSAYQKGLMGMVTGSEGKSFSLDKVKSSVKEKACDFVLNNAKSLI